MEYPMIDISLIKSSIPLLLRGVSVTLQIAALSCSIGFIFGTILGFGLTTRKYAIRWATNIYTTLFRGTPMLTQVVFAALILPTLGIPISRFWAVVFAIGLNSSAYIAHVIAAGIKSISKGQIEAAQTLGFSHLQIMRFIILPQAIRTVIPALGNEFITLVKDSSLASIVGIQELTKEGEIIASQTYDALSIYVAVGICYLIITTILTALVNHIEQRINIHA
jgi:arginine/lysine/histidine transport system permease protein